MDDSADDRASSGGASSSKGRTSTRSGSKVTRLENRSKKYVIQMRDFFFWWVVDLMFVFPLFFVCHSFPGAQPISFAAPHLEELGNENYFVSEKADGIRCLFLTTTDRDGRGQTFLVGFSFRF